MVNSNEDYIEVLSRSSPEMDLDRIFEELPSGGKVSVERKEPDWANGHVDTIHFDGTEPISIDWLKEKFGGRKLLVRVFDGKGYKGGRTVNIAGPPRNGKGVELVKGPDGEQCLVTELGKVTRRYNALQGIPDPPQAIVPAQPTQDTALMKVLLETQAAQAANIQNALIGRINHLETIQVQAQVAPPAPPGPPAPPYDPLGQMKQTMETIKHLEEIKGTLTAGESGEGNIGQYAEILSKFFDWESQKQQNQLAILQAQLAARGQLPPGAPPPGAQTAAPPLPDPELAQVGEQLPDHPPGAPPPPGRPGAPPGPAGLRPDVSNDQLMALVVERLPNLTADERHAYAEEMLGAEIEKETDGGDYDDSENAENDGQPGKRDINSNLGSGPKENNQDGQKSPQIPFPGPQI